MWHTQPLICDLAPAAIEQAVQALEQHVLRGTDAIHIGAALHGQAQVFITADLRQAQAATAMGLNVQLLWALAVWAPSQAPSQRHRRPGP